MNIEDLWKSGEILDQYYDEINQATMIRECERALLDLVQQGKIGGTIHTCIGQELAPIFVAKELTEHDYIFSNHRGHGHYLATTCDYHGLVAELLGKASGSCMGIGGSQHLHKGNFYSNGVQGGMVPIAAGAAVAMKYHKNDGVAIVYIGDGTLGEGVLYETLNICSLWELPVVFVIENNGVAQSTPFSDACAGTIQARADAFEITYYQCNGQDIRSLERNIPDAISFARTQQKPVILEVLSSRLMAHSKGDDNRPEETIRKLWENDFLTLLNKKFPKRMNVINKECVDFIKNILKDIGTDSEANIETSSISYFEIDFDYLKISSDDNLYNSLIYQELKNNLEKNSSTFLLGEDIKNSSASYPKEYGGAFKVTRDLSNIFEGRVKNTPISEAAIIGISTGMALNGMKPISEIMFGDFTTLIFDQVIQHACKIVSMYGRNIDLPVVIRTPMGGGRGYGPTHSQSLEKFFLGIENLDVVALNHRLHPSHIFNYIESQLKTPLLLVEHKKLYTQRYGSNVCKAYDYFISNEACPTILLKPKGQKTRSIITILTYGGMFIDVEAILDDLFFEEDILCDVIVYSKLNDFDLTPVLNSLKDTGRVIIIEEGPTFSGWSAEVLSRIIESGHAPIVKRLGNNNLIPSARHLEDQVIVTSEKVYKEIVDLVHG